MIEKMLPTLSKKIHERNMNVLSGGFDVANQLLGFDDSIYDDALVQTAVGELQHQTRAVLDRLHQVEIAIEMEVE